MELYYHSTRNEKERVSASKAILQGLANDGGLFVPESIPALDTDLDHLKDMSYKEVAYEVMKLFLTDFTKEELMYCIEHAYDDKFDTKELVPLKKVDNAWVLELFHGPTIAFKDMALSILPYLMTTSAQKNALKEEIIILTATSGDTGKAAMAGFADVPGTRIVVFYPKNGVSPVQEKQMLTQRGKNVKVVGITGNFDDAQSGVKQMFHDGALKEKLREGGFVFSSANSINIGRLVPQVVYYVYACAQLLKRGAVKPGEKINVCVPTGNFGNILAAYYAKKMGAPIGRLICASNSNKVLYDFFRTGTYDKLHSLDEKAGEFNTDRHFMLTSSPSMDILISSNLERLIYTITGEDTKKNSAYMESLAKEGKYHLSDAEKAKLADFTGGCAGEEEVAQRIKEVFESDGYIMDTHTAVASSVEKKCRRELGGAATLIASTASPYKFLRSVLSAIDEKKYASLSDEALFNEMEKLSSVAIPPAIQDILSAPVLHDTVCETGDMEKEVLKFLGL